MATIAEYSNFNYAVASCIDPRKADKRNALLFAYLNHIIEAFLEAIRLSRLTCERPHRTHCTHHFIGDLVRTCDCRLRSL